MKQSAKRWLAQLLVLTMCLSLFPSMAFAEGTEDAGEETLLEVTQGVEENTQIPASIHLHTYYDGVNLRVPAGVTLNVYGALETSNDVFVEGTLNNMGGWCSRIWANNYVITESLYNNGQIYVCNGTITGLDRIARGNESYFPKVNLPERGKSQWLCDKLDRVR